MKVYRKHEQLAELLATTPVDSADRELREEVRHQFNQLLESGYLDPSDLMCVVEMENVDEVGELEAVLGVGVLCNKWTGIHYGFDGFTPTWESLERYDHWYVAVFVLGDDGYGYLVFVPKGHDSALPSVFEHYIA